MAKEKEVTLSITIKQLALKMDDTSFDATMQETLDSLKTRLSDARVRYQEYQAMKDLAVEGIPTLEEKGITFTISGTF